MILNIPTFGLFYALLVFIALIISVSIHECSHALIAYFRGDSTAKDYGRLTLNPISHFEPFGFLMMLFTNFGWGKPVPINPNNMHKPKTDNLLVAIAGPISNILTAILASLLLRLLLLAPDSSPVVFNLGVFLEVMVTINIGLAVFNLLPFPPLDGSNIYRPFLPYSIQYKIAQFSEGYIIILLLLAFLPLINGQSAISFILSPIITSLSTLLLP